MADPTAITDSSQIRTTPPHPGAARLGPAEPEGKHKPYVPASSILPEFTLRAVLLGAVLGIIFGASSLYLVLKVGMTVSASIPVAVLSITLFRLFTRFVGGKATILENNIVQTAGSAGESIAFGVGVTMPALMLLGFEMNIGRVLVVSVLGGLLGILMMIPLRRAFIVQQHGKLVYPEGKACADVLVAGEQGGATALTVFVGFTVAFVYEFLRLGLKLFKEAPERALTWFKGAVPAIEVNPALLGVGYIIGTRISCVMVGGGVLASFVLIPAIRLFGDGLSQPLYPASKLISKMSEEEIWHEYILYIGAGAVAAGGIISLVQALPLIAGSIRAAFRDLASGVVARVTGPERTDSDLPLWVVGAGSVLLVIGIWLTTPLHWFLPWVPQLHMGPVGALLIVLFGFLFVTVSSRLTGEIGSSSNPISGMTVATLLLTCLIFVLLGWTRPEDRLTALSVAAVVCIAASNGGTTSQDLKTGYLVGATPRWQQIAILVGALSSALVIGYILIRLNDAYTIYSTRNLPPLKQPLDVSKLTETGRAPSDPTVYHVWRPAEGNDQQVPPGQYLVDDEGEIRYLVDPGINGKRTHRDDGTEVPRFKAPKAVLMSLITDGILRGKLPWTLVLLGVAIAVVLELCGVPSLAFAVGVYLPLSSSTPIFFGGLVRYLADWRARTSRARTSGAHAGEPELNEADSDTSPASLLSTGYIAGGAIAGVLIAFLSFSDEIPAWLAHWQYRSVAITREVPAADAYRLAALNELRLRGDVPPEKAAQVEELTGAIAELNSDNEIRYVPVPAGTVLKLPQAQSYTPDEDTTLGRVAREQLGREGKAALLWSLNLDRLVRVPAGASLDLGEGKTYKAERQESLGEAAQKALGKSERAQELYERNEDALKPNVRLPAGTPLRLPQETWPALAAFGALTLLLALVSLGLLFRQPAPAAQPAAAA